MANSNPKKNFNAFAQSGALHGSNVQSWAQTLPPKAESSQIKPDNPFATPKAEDPFPRLQQTGEEAANARAAVTNEAKTADQAISNLTTSAGSPFYKKPLENADVLTEREYQESLINPKIDSNPSIVFAADFLPLYDSGTATNTEKLLNTKEISQLHIAMNAANYVKNKTNLGDTVIPKTRKEILDLVAVEIDDIDTYFSAKSQARKVLDIKNYAVDIEDIPFASPDITPVNISQLVTNYILTDEKQYSNTKLWYLFCAELSAQLQTYSNILTSTTVALSKKTQSIEDLKYKLIDIIPMTSNQMLLSEVGGQIYGYKLTSKSKYFPSSIKTIEEYADKYSPPAVKFVRRDFVMSNFLDNCIVDVTGDDRGTLYKLSELDKRIGKEGASIALLATVLAKVRNYSRAVNSSKQLSNEGGLSAYDIFHKVVGNIPSDDIRNLNEIEFFDVFKNSLIGFSSVEVETNKGIGYSALFEEDYLTTDSGSVIIPGDIYFIDKPTIVKEDKDGAMKIDTSRIKRVSTLAKNHSDNFKKLYGMVGLNRGTLNKSTTSVDLLHNIRKKGSLRSSGIYKSFFKKEDNVISVDYKKFSDERLRSNSRLAAMFFAAAVNPNNEWQIKCNLKEYLFSYLLSKLNRKNPTISSNQILTATQVTEQLKTDIKSWLLNEALLKHSLIVTAEPIDGWINLNNPYHALLWKSDLESMKTSQPLPVPEVGFDEVAQEILARSLDDSFSTVSVINTTPTNNEIPANEQKFGSLIDSIFYFSKFQEENNTANNPIMSLSEAIEFFDALRVSIADENTQGYGKGKPRASARAMNIAQEAGREFGSFMEGEWVQEFVNELVDAITSSNYFKVFFEDLIGTIRSQADVFKNDASTWANVGYESFLACWFNLYLKAYTETIPDELGKIGLRVKSTKFKPPGEKKEKYQTIKSAYIANSVKDFNDEFEFSNTNENLTYSSKYMNSAMALCHSEQKSLLNKIAYAVKYLNSIRKTFDNLIQKTDSDLKPFLKRREELLMSDDGISKNPAATVQLPLLQKNDIDNPTLAALLSNSLSEEQLKLTKYMLSEIKDRLSDDSDIREKLKSAAALTNMPANMAKMTPINDVSLISHSALGYYFKFNKFNSNNAINGKILGVGIPHSLVKRVTGKVSSFSSNDANKNIIKMKLYKVDFVNPKIVYKPQEFLFDANLFPTKTLKNWQIEHFINDDNDYLGVGDIPLKYFNEKTMQVELIKSRSTNHFEKYYKQAGLTIDEYKEMYNNHAISYLLDEYVKWFTDADFSETRYSKYNNVAKYSSNAFQAYDTFIASNPTTTAETVNSENSEQKQTQISKNIKWDKISFADLADSVKLYFYNETFLLNVDQIKRNLLYPKKFDRVFNLFFDPDDFVVDTALTNKDKLKALIDAGVIVEKKLNDNTKRYVHRNTKQNDPQFEEYFVTIEPFALAASSLYE